MFIGHYAVAFVAKRAAPAISLGTMFLAVQLAGPPPPSVAALAWSANGLWLVVAWGYWIDRYRGVRP